MPFRNNALSLRHMLQAAEDIEAFLGDKDLAACLADRRTMLSVERSLQILTEAAFSFLRHEYDRVDDELIWNTSKRNVPVVSAAVAAALSQLETPQP